MKKLTLREMISLARKKGGRCLSTSYSDSATALLWRCSAGHRWSAVPASIRKGSWCPECAGVRRTTLGEVQHIAVTRGGSCLSSVCPNGVAKLRWRCSEGHEWTATPSQVKRGHWCPFCARIVRPTPQDLRRMAASRGGEYLSPKLKTSSDLARWRCALGHIWQARAKSLRAGHWCPVCADNRRLTLDQMQRIARKRGGKCLSRHYKNGCTPLRWECGVGHRWRASPTSVRGGRRKKGTWCPECYNARRTFHKTHDIELMGEIALNRQGKCLSTQYL
ncbi:MAG: zinc-ribbon domain-containing protein, partial [Gammaproteobacteria bacterium]